MSSATQIAVVGIGRTPYLRSRVMTRNPLALATEAARQAIDDAGLRCEQIDGLACYGMNDTATFAQVADALGIKELTWNVDVYGGGTGSYSSVQAASAALQNGDCTYAVVYRSLCGRSGLRYGDGAGMAVLLSHPDQEFDYAAGYVIPPQWFAMWATRHQHEFGTSAEDLAAIAITQRTHAVNNEHAVMRSPMTMQDYHAAPIVSTPLRTYDCSLEVDGACAIVLTTLDRAVDLPHRPILLEGGVSTWGAGGSYNNWPDFTEMYAARIAPRFWGRFGISPSDIDVACIYDCFTYTVLAVMEGLGFCERGGVGDYFRSGRATYGGDVVVNPHGGLLSEGYIHGFNHHYEAVLQLRHDAGERQVDDCTTAIVTAGACPYGGALLYRRYE